MIEYKLIPSEWAEPGDEDERQQVGVFEDGVLFKRLASDGGEPEDNTFSRDWSWVVPALNDAYLRGLKQA
jgi:hypothetical protein